MKNNSITITITITLKKMVIDYQIDYQSEAITHLWLQRKKSMEKRLECQQTMSPKKFVSPEFFSGPDFSRIPPKSFGHIRRNFRIGDQKYKFFSPEKTTSEDELISSGLFRCSRISISVSTFSSGMRRVLETKK